MIRNMTLGKYYKADSVIHALDPRVKLAGTLLYVITLFFPKNLPGLLLATLFLFWVIALSKVPFGIVLRGVKPLFFILCFSAAVNLCFTEGEILWEWGPVHISKEGIVLSCYLVVRLTWLIMGSSIMTFTTTPGELADGLEKSLGFLNRIRIPVHEFAMMLSIALRFIPVLTEELDKIMKAQTSRGVDFTEGNLIERGRKLLPILIPLFVSAIRRSQELAFAMEARAYHGGAGRTKLHPLHYERRDRTAYLVLAVYVAAMLGLSLFMRGIL